ncbi:L-fucono-1,5-lactonase-like isoform X2 [Macrobrachium rosenbergii]|uniref:L-fucono-1,5-lactonase-like isoform X2 n=1 Tax=Macrobrachium rosenbergii TaxID=79674 RepID=UPI0034D45D27
MVNWTENILDSHFHIWELERFQYPWPTPDMVIHRNHQVKDLLAAASETPVKQFVFVQCLNDSPDEAKWVMSLAKENPCIKGIVAGLDPSCPQFGERLKKLKEDVPLLVGIRHIMDLETHQEEFLMKDEVAASMKALASQNLTYDLLLRPPLVKAATVLVSKSPECKFVVDHLAKPYIAKGIFDPWSEQMTELARHPNVYCKLSSMITEADLENWKTDDFRPYVEHMLKVFGPDRLMFGSDWPVCRLARNTDYGTVYNTLRQLLSHLPEDQLKKIFCYNARRFYNIP